MKSYKKEIAVCAAMALFTPLVNAAGPDFDESVTVKPATAPVDTLSATGAEGVPPTIENNGDGTSTVSSRISTVEAQRKSVTSGGVEIDTNGNVTLSPMELTESNLRYGIFSQFDVDNATNTPTTSTTYIAAVVDEQGDFVSELSGVAVDTTDSDPLKWTINLDDPSLNTDAILVDTSTITAYGDLQVGGNANVDGVLSLAAGDPDGVADSGDEWDAVANVAKAIGDNAADIATLNGDATVVGSVANSIAAANSYADVVAADAEADAIAAANLYADGLADNYDAAGSAATAEANANAYADGLAVNYDAAGSAATAEANANAYTDGVAADLQSDIDRNARGIAMVAALTHTTVLPGMTHALDVSAAHFEGETGMAISYSRRFKDGVQINFGAASTTDFDESVVRGGIGWQW